jgi:hypothetical protein
LLSDITHLQCTDTTFGCNLNQLTIWTGLTYLNLADGVTSGVLSSISGLTSLTTLRLQDTAITGALTDVAAMTSLITLMLKGNPITGNLSDISGLISLLTCYLYDTNIGVTTGSLPAWSNINLRVHNCNLTATEVDNALVQLNIAGGTSGSLQIHGSNAIPGPTGAAAITSLLGKSWTITYNEQEAAFETTKTSATLSITFRGTNGTSIEVDWGQGTPDTVNLLGPSTPVIASNLYDATPGTKNIVVSGLLSEDVTYFNCTDSTFSGAVGGFDIMRSLTHLQFNSTGISGDIVGLADLAYLTHIQIDASSVTGSVNNLQTALLTYCQINSTALSGTIDAFAPATSMTTLILFLTSITGDIGDLAPLTSLGLLNASLNSLGYSDTTLPAWGGTYYLNDNGMTAGEVNAVLIDFDTAGASNGTLNVSGTNAAPTGAGITALISLLGKGWTITVTLGSELMVDGDMEAVGVAAYTPINSPTLTKEVASPYEGSQNLRVAYLATSYPSCYQAILTIGKAYRVTGAGRGDGSVIPKIYNNVYGTVWSGTSSTTWQPFDVIITSAGHANLLFQCITTGAGYAEFDDISVKEIV